LPGNWPWAPEDDESARCSCWSVSTLACRVSTVAVNLVMRATRSDVVGSAIGDKADEVGEGGTGANGTATVVVLWGWLEVEEDHPNTDTRLSRASVPKTAGPRLRSS